MPNLYPSRIKICGITSVDDALSAVEAGARTLGLVFHPPSPRHLTEETAKEIVDALPPDVITFGVVVDRPLDKVARMAERVGLTALQVHGKESNAYLRALGRPVVKGLRIRTSEDLARIADYPDADAILLDAWSPTAAGGTGLTCDWDALSTADLGDRPVVLAGGLTAEHVSRAIHLVRPSAVDVSSGVETRPGVKDNNRMRAFCWSAQAAFQELSHRRQA